MSRRRVVAIVSAGVILVIGLAVAIAFVSLTQTALGREYIRDILRSQIASRMKGRGTMYVGRITGGLLTGVTLDSFAIRDAEDSLFVSTGPVRIEYDPRDLLDKRLFFRSVQIERPVVNLRRHSDGEWNFRRILPRGVKRPKSAQRKYGDFVVLDTAVIQDGTVILTMPWEPPDSLTGARRDSVVRYVLSASDLEVRSTKEGLKRTRRWTRLDASFTYVRIADPDSAGRLISVGRLDVKESDPPFEFRNVSGPVRILGDTAWFEARHFDLPASTGSAKGKVHWGKGPMRYDIDVVGDSVALNDVAWVYPTLPRTGGGRLKLHIVNNPRNPDVLEYALRDMDIRSTRSHLTGAMTFGVGGPVLVVKDVALRADPLDFDLVRTLGGGPFPVDWQGQITGTIEARGGPLNRWVVDEARFTFRDAHVPGAITRASASGGLDILFPAFTVFRGLQVDVETLDTRTVQYLFPDFPRVGGTVSGTARLDSSWLDVRFSNADVLHRNGPGAPSRALGSGRVTYGEKFVAFDLDMQADPLSFTALARAYPAIPLRGTFSGPLRVKGTVEDLDVAGRLTGAAGTFSVDGHFDLFPSGYAARAAGGVRDLNIRTLFARDDLPATFLNASFTADVSGDSLANLSGAVDLEIDRSRIDTLRILPSVARFAFGDGRLRVDSLRLETSAANVTAGGAFGLSAAVSDTLRYEIVVDSLGGLRPWLMKKAGNSLAAADGDSAEPTVRDSLSGTVTLTGALSGSVAAVATSGRVNGSALVMLGHNARLLSGEYAFEDIAADPRGSFSIRLDTLQIAGVRLDSVHARGVLANSSSARVSLEVGAPKDVQVRGAAALAWENEHVSVGVDTLGLVFGDRRWALVAPVVISADSSGLSMDSLVLRDGAGGRVTLTGNLPVEAPVTASFVLDSFPLADAGLLVQTRSPVRGLLQLDLKIAGTRKDPLMQLSATAQGAGIGDVRLPFVTGTASYSARNARTAFQLYRDGKPLLSLDAMLPVDLSLVPVDLRLIPDSLRVTLRADSADLSIVEALSPNFQRVSGTISTAIDIGGTWRRPTIGGSLAIQNGEAGLPRLGIRLQNLNTDVAMGRDSILIRRFSAQSGPQRGDTLSLGGVVRLRDPTDYQSAVFDLRLFANHFQTIQRRRLADLEVSGQLHLAGPYEHARIDGGLVVDRGVIYLPEQARKEVVSLADSDAYNIIDTSLVANQNLLPRAPPAFVKNLTLENVGITVGENVWLRSAEANIKLSGRVQVTSDGNQLALAGNLQADRGTYRLDLGPVQRTFLVDRGQIRFFGRSDIPAELDISASYTVRQVNRQDVRIRAHIGGTLAQLRLNLTTDERIPISPTEILSYLVFGAPTFIAADNANALRPVAQALLPTIGGVLERALSDQFGSFLDIVTIQAGNVGEQSLLTRTGAGGVLSGTRIGVGGQLSERTFVTVNAGLCKLGSLGGTNTDNLSFTEALGFTVEHRLNHGFSVQTGVEPASSALLCGRRGEFNIPRQLGFDLFREWSF